MDMSLMDIQERIKSGTSWTYNDKFEKNGYLILRNLWDPRELYHPLPPVRGKVEYVDKNPEHYNHEEVENQVPGSLARYWYPQYRTIHSGVRRKLEEVIGMKIYNTYYYDRYYFFGQELTKHIDRDACEISVSIHINTNFPTDLKDWPIKIKTPDTYTNKEKNAIVSVGEEHSVILNPGDALLYKGCERPHWRDPLPSLPKKQVVKWANSLQYVKDIEYYYHQIFFHYVLQDGERSHCAWDHNR